MSIKTGFSKICITPKYGTPILGYYKKRTSKGVLDDLYIRGIAFDDGENRAVVLAADLCVMSNAIADGYRKAISEACGLDMNAIFINCNHTHQGPIFYFDHATDTDGDEFYKEFLTRSMVDAAIYALNDLKPSEFYSAETEAKGISFVRRFRMKDGTVATNPGPWNPQIDHALGEPCEILKLVKIVREGADDICIVSFGTHPDTIGGDLISADWPGLACATLESALPGTKAFFLLAPQGDVNHVNVFPDEYYNVGVEVDFDDVPRGYAHAQHMGRVIAGAALSVYTKTVKLNSDKLTIASSTVDIPTHRENHRLDEARKIKELHDAGRDNELPYKGMMLTTKVAEATRILDLENGPDFFTYGIYGLAIGDLAITAIPGEPFTEIATRIYDASPFKTTLLACLTNGGGVYFATTKSYDEGGYEACSSPLAPGGDDIVVNGMTELLKKLK